MHVRPKHVRAGVTKHASVVNDPQHFRHAPTLNDKSNVCRTSASMTMLQRRFLESLKHTRCSQTQHSRPAMTSEGSTQSVLQCTTTEQCMKTPSMRCFGATVTTLVSIRPLDLAQHLPLIGEQSLLKLAVLYAVPQQTRIVLQPQ